MKRVLSSFALLALLAASPARAEGPEAQLPPLPAAPAPAPAPAPTPSDLPNVTVLQAPALATHEAPLVEGPPPHRRHFYESGWFWGAIAAAAFAGGAVYLATRDTSSPTIHLQLKVPQ
jgi:hypothetical protein